MSIGVLITGGTGTFGRAFVPHLLAMERVHRIVVLSRDEFKQADMERGYVGHPNFGKLNFFVGDVRDESRLDMALYDINYVVHAAAMKRIEKCERDPIEAVQTNVNGTINVIRAALRQPKMINVVGLSTDKACNPINLYGATKLAAEKLLAAANNLSGGRIKFSAVRYGNIFGSRGSVVDIWRRLDERTHRQLVITDPEATRFFMTIEQAVELVDHQLFSMDPPTLKLPASLPAYRLGDLAAAMGHYPGDGLDIKGLSRYEKLHEELCPGYSSDTAHKMKVLELAKELQRLK